MAVKLARKSAELTSTQVERFFRKQILTGEMPPGTKLPPNQILSRQWSSSTAAIQKALAALAAEGLIERRQRRGTFVRDAAQHACIGVLVGPDLIYGTSSVYRILSSSIQAKLDSLYLKTRIYDNLTFPQSKTSHHGNFQADRNSYSFKGYVLIGTANVADEHISDAIQPRAVFQDSVRGSDVILDYSSFAKESLVQLAQRGFKRITYFRGVQSAPIDQSKTEVEGLNETARSLSLPKPKTWSLAVTGNSATYELEIHQKVEELFEKLGTGLKNEMPEVFLVQDDICARPLIVNLLKRGIRIPKDVKICVQSTSHNHVYYGVPAYHYEFSVDEVADSLCDILYGRLKNLEPENLPRWIQGKFLDPAL